ncbi:5-(carboxyamino)imidazole ribonucleotide synthase [Peribacillus sp. SCS-155]|uniref:5-(carboxyamino)imidazole ribonucleotide synthase n=1 Tax=Peribacillus sedimenti TaxID=3115297 RepID=UPI003906038B
MSSLNKKVILPGQTIGIIGGGQLGRMMALSAKAMGFNIAVLDPAPNCPCGQVADIEITGAYDDTEKLKELAAVSDVITFEFENINAPALGWLSRHAYIPQGAELLKITQNRISEKDAISAAGVPVAPYFVISNKEDLGRYAERLGYPCVLKTARGGYDGKGQYVLRSAEDIDKATEILEAGECVLEGWVAFTKEISVIINRSIHGEHSILPIAENIHKNNILDKSIVPARISEAARNKAILQAEKLAKELGLVGTLAVEMFLTVDDEIIINELAPRPHNSGHYSIDACATSQFEQHIRAVCGWPLGSTNLLKSVVMVNILGQHVHPIINNISKISDWKIHLYGKQEAKVNRKMGHVNILRETADEALKECMESKLWDSEEYMEVLR